MAGLLRPHSHTQGSHFPTPNSAYKYHLSAYKFTTAFLSVTELSFSLYSPTFELGSSEGGMSFLFIRRPNGYAKMDKEDQEERIHRKAQFLIYKVLDRADSRGRPSYLRIRIRKLKVRIGRRFKKLKSAVSGISAGKIGVYKQVISQLKNCKHLFRRRETTTIANLPPLLS